MVINYTRFKKMIIDATKIRSKNFTNTDCNMNTLMDIVWQDIQSVCVFEWSLYSVEIKNDMDPIVAVPQENTDPETRETISILGEVYDITDDEGNNIVNYVELIEPKVYHINEQYIESHEGDYIHFVMPVRKPLEDMPSNILNRMVTVFIEGIMWHIQQSIPNPNDMQVGAAPEYQRYELEKKKLINQFPQIMYKQKGIRNGSYSKL